MIESEKAVLLSIQPKWCELIASGQKTIEVRKTKPKLSTPFKCYIYQTKRTWIYNIYSKIADWQGKVIGEFVCDTIITDRTFGHDLFFNVLSCMSEAEIAAYCTNNKMHGWHISDLVIYDKPKELNEFITPSRVGCCNEGKCKDCKWLNRGNGFDIEDDCLSPFDTDEYKPLTRPPQSWCYVERLVDEQ